MANALKGKTLTTLTVILPNEKVAVEMMDGVSSHLEFMQEKSYRDGPLKLIQYFVSSGPEWKESASFLATVEACCRGCSDEATANKGSAQHQQVEV